MEILVDKEKCSGCGKCSEICPKGPRIWKIEDHGGKRIARVLDINYCLNCGSCASFCPTNAIKIEWLE
jgi:NAD-dependent dihydropyrimidine dehydrogenase PreA subunit